MEAAKRLSSIDEVRDEPVYFNAAPHGWDKTSHARGDSTDIRRGSTSKGAPSSGTLQVSSTRL